MKKLLSLVLAVILALSLGTQVLALDLGVIQIGGPGEESSHAEPGSMEIKLNDTLAIDGWGEITLTKVEFRDSFSLFIDEGWWEDYYAGMEADYLVIYLDIINTGLTAHDFMAGALSNADTTPMVKVVYKEVYEYKGKGFQVNQDWDDDGLIGLDSDLNYPVEPMYVGHYMFVCKLPNAVIERKDSLSVTFCVDENDFTYTIRK